MQLWKKNYLLTLAIFTLLLSLGISALVSVLFYEEYQQEIKATVTEKSTLEEILTLNPNTLSNTEGLLNLTEHLSEDGRYLQISRGEENELLVNTFPGFSPNFLESTALVRQGQIPFLLSTDTIHQDGQSFTLYYGKNLSPLYRSHYQRVLASWLIFLTLLLAVGIIQYLAMKKIYTPVSQISHELRNPLTTIQGYAQYLQAGCLTEDDRLFAQEQLIAETANLRRLVDKLLIMGNLREGKIRTQQIDMDHLLLDIKRQYPSLSVENQIHRVTGDEALLKSLLLNVTSNAYQASGCVRLYTVQNQIRIWNAGESMDSQTLETLNKGKELAPSLVKGYGVGIRICRDIVRLYHGNLRYHIPSQGGTEAVISLPWSMVTLKDTATGR